MLAFLQPVKIFIPSGMYEPFLNTRAPLARHPAGLNHAFNVYTADVDDGIDTSLGDKSPTEEDRSAQSMTPQMMDPITHAGGLNIQRIAYFASIVGFTWLLLSLDIIVEGNIDRLGIPKDTPRPKVYNFDFEKKRRRTRGEFNPYLPLLEDWNVLESAEVDSREFARAAAKFFCVLKANGKLRAIFDSRMAGEMGSRPPPVRLPFLSTVIKRGAECKHFWTADFKHWFYQIRICYKLREFFVTKCSVLQGKRRRTFFRRMKVLPQGWSWSPFIAQSLGWSVIMYRHSPELEDLFNEKALRSSIELPSFIEHRSSPNSDPLATVFLWYDNILVCGNSKDAVREDFEVHSRQCRASEHLNATFSAKDSDISDTAT